MNNFRLKTKKAFTKKGVDSVWGQGALHLVMWTIVILSLFPLITTIMFSFRGYKDFQKGFWALPEKLMWSNFAFGFNRVIANMLNSVLVAVTVAVCSVMISAFVAYVFVHKKFFGKKFLFALIISLMMVPGVLTLTPRYVLIQNLNLIDSWFALILPWTSGHLVGGVFIFRTFMGQQPKELFESATIDGGGDFTLFLNIALPLAVPIIVIQLVGTVSGCYNDYIWSLLVINNDSIQMLMPLLKNIVAESQLNTGNPGITHAIYLVSGIPLLITTSIGLKYFINGDFASGLKM